MYHRRCSLFQELDQYLLAGTCIHLACKQTEIGRKLRDVVNATYYIVHQAYLEVDDVSRVDPDILELEIQYDSV